uniref:Uncharacterized protein n=1 Tax=Physcomitrium patens TaxID=3218 RepID=A0A2K1JDC2_PHYPA|nr:hypothetical protein PHYPA_019803 [Physcomitrium patens]
MDWHRQRLSVLLAAQLGGSNVVATGQSRASSYNSPSPLCDSHIWSLELGVLLHFSLLPFWWTSSGPFELIELSSAEDGIFRSYSFIDPIVVGATVTRKE